MNKIIKGYFNNYDTLNIQNNYKLLPSQDKKVDNIIDNLVDSISFPPSNKMNFLPGNFKIMDILFKPLKKDKKHIESKKKEEEKKYVFDENKEYIDLDCEVNNLDDLIKLGKSFNEDLIDQYPIDMKKLNKLVEPLEELNNTIGLDSVKENIVNQIIYYLQDLDEDKNLMHTVITGPPGVGKTMLGYILSKIYYAMGIVPTDNKKYINPLNGKKENFKFVIARRSDLIGEYVGHTAVKTQKVIDSALGGVLFIDEAYSLGSDEKKDSFSKECIDTLNQNLTENKGKFICIIAGYQNALQKFFFNYNAGLSRRFSFRYNIENYDYKKLAQIYLKKIDDSKWNLFSNDKDYIEKIEKIFKDNYDKMPNFGGDVELLLFYTKISHSLRVFGKNHGLRKKINLEDIKNGFKKFQKKKSYKFDYKNLYL